MTFRIAVHLAWVLLSCTHFAACSGQRTPTQGETGAKRGSSTQSDAKDPVTVASGDLTVTVTRTVGEDWPKFLGPNSDGTSSEQGVLPELWNPHPPVVWKKQLGVSYGGPTISQGRLFQFDRFGDRERLTCYEAESGREIWRQEIEVIYADNYGYNNGPRCSPIIDGDLVFTYGVAGQLTCVESESGKVRWTKNLTEEYSVVQNFFGVASCPVIFEDLLLVMVGGSPPESLELSASQLDEVQPNGTAIVALDKLTGEQRYQLGDDLASYSSLTIRTINDQPTGLAFLRSGLTAWEPKSGDILFQFPWRAPILESVNAAQPVVSGDQILLSEAYEVGSVLLDLAAGQPSVLWQDSGSLRSHAFRAHWSTPVLIDGYLYGCSGRNQPDSDFRCVRLSDGEVQWTDRRHERSSVLSVDNYLIVLGEYGRLELISPTPEKLTVIAEAELDQPVDGQPLLQYPCWAAPVLSHGLLYVRGKDFLYCFDLIPPVDAIGTK